MNIDPKEENWQQNTKLNDFFDLFQNANQPFLNIPFITKKGNLFVNCFWSLGVCSPCFWSQGTESRDQKEKNGAVFYINYFSNKAVTNRYNYELTDIKDNVNILKNYDYLYTYSLYNNDLQLHKLYKIETINGKLELVKVGQ